MSALGQQPVNNSLIVACGRLLPGCAYRSFSWWLPNRRILNGCFHQQQSFKLFELPFCEGLESAKWFCPGLMDNFVLTACPLLELHRTDVTKIVMATFTIVKTLDVLEQIGPRLGSSSVSYPVDTFAFQ